MTSLIPSYSWVGENQPGTAPRSPHQHQIQTSSSQHWDWENVRYFVAHWMNACIVLLVLFGRHKTQGRWHVEQARGGRSDAWQVTWQGSLVTNCNAVSTGVGDTGHTLGPCSYIWRGHSLLTTTTTSHSLHCQVGTLRPAVVGAALTRTGEMFDSLYLCTHLYTHGWKFRSLAPSFSVFPWPGAGARLKVM